MIALPTSTLIAALAVLALGSARAADAKPEPKLTPEDIKLADKDAVLPLPGEILSVMKGFKPADWKGAAAAAAAAKTPAPADKADSAATAARLGTRTADAFLAIEAQDSDLLDKAAADILAAATKLGATKEILANAELIRTAAASGKWVMVLPLLDQTYHDARKAVNDIGNKDGVAIASAAGWLRGVDIFAGELATKYSDKASKALRQGDLTGKLLANLEAMPASTKSKPNVDALIKALTTIKPLVSVSTEATVPQPVVQQIAAAAKAAVMAQY